MFRAIAYKEWLKIRWVWFGLLIVCLAAAGNVLLSLQHLIRFTSAITVWTRVVFLGDQYYGSLRFLPLLVGLAIAGAQFVPEVLSWRLTLSLHLPMRENEMILRMLSVGYLAAVSLFLLVTVLVCLIGALYFPREIVVGALINVTPWVLAGSVGYFVLAAVIVEPRWIQKAILLLVGAGFVDLLLQSAPDRAFAPSLLIFLGLTAFLSILIVLAGHRFRRGVR